MKIVHEDGTIEYTNNNPGRLDREPFQLGPGGKPRKTPICGSNKKNGGICHLTAGHGTDHLGYGNCYLHTGNKQELGRGVLKWNLIDMENFPGIKAKANALRVEAESKDVFDLRQHIFLMEAITLTIMEKAKTMEDLGAALQYLEKCTKVIQRLDEIEHGRRLVIDYQGVTLILAKVEDSIKRNVRDSYTKDLIGRDLAGILTEGIGSQDLPNSEQGALIESVAMEVSSRKRNQD